MHYSTIFSNPKNKGGGSQSARYKLLLLGQDIPSLDDTVNNIVDIEHLFPLWLREKNNENSSGTLLDFTQEYYNWLYDKSGYELSTVDFNPSGFQKIVDINETPVQFLDHFVKTYVSGFPEQFVSGLLEDDENLANSVGIRNFISGIRQFFYQKKSNEEAYRYFFEMLYGDQYDENGDPIDVNVNLYYPKTHMLRLNGGRFDGFPYADPSGVTGTYFDEDGDDGPDKAAIHLGGSYLNGPFSIQDSNWFQEYSYVLSTEVPLVDEETGQPIYTELLKSLLHPAGLKMFLEKTQDDYVAPDDYDGGFNVIETSVLGNYFPYRLNDHESLDHCTGCSGESGYHYDGPTAMYNLLSEGELGGIHGWTYGNAWNAVGSGGITLDYHMPTYAYPSWSDGIFGDPEQNVFGNIYIGAFMYLSPSNGSPNLGATGCTAYGDADAGACWS